jgi:hypothetical protein
MRKGNHRRTKSTHPDELNKMMFSLASAAGAAAGQSLQPEDVIQEIVVEEVKIDLEKPNQ